MQQKEQRRNVGREKSRSQPKRRGQQRGRGPSYGSYLNKNFYNGRNVLSVRRQYRNYASRKQKDSSLDAQEMQLINLARAARDEITRRSGMVADNQSSGVESDRFSEGAPEHAGENNDSASNDDDNYQAGDVGSPLVQNRSQKKKELSRKRKNRKRLGGDKTKKKRKKRDKKPKTVMELVQNMAESDQKGQQMNAMAMAMMAAVVGAVMKNFMGINPLAMANKGNNMDDDDDESGNESDDESSEENYDEDDGNNKE